MSYGEEQREEMEIKWEIAMMQARQQVTDRIWTTKDGERIPVEAMEESHIANCIRMLQKQIDRDDEEEDGECRMPDEVYNIKKAWIKAFEDELNKRAGRRRG